MGSLIILCQALGEMFIALLASVFIGLGWTCVQIGMLLMRLIPHRK